MGQDFARERSPERLPASVEVPPHGKSVAETDAVNDHQAATDLGLPGDRVFPNTDAGDPNYIALEVPTCLQSPRHIHRLAVSCDDGFAVW